MNREWSELNGRMQEQIKKKDAFRDGVETLFELRRRLMDTMVSFADELSREDFNAIPFINANGYHSKTIAYSLWHIFRIEDIVAHTLINADEQIFFRGGYKARINSPTATTGNELVKRQIYEFSEQLDLNELYSYIFEVSAGTEEIVRGLSFEDMQKGVPDERREALKALKVVSEDENAAWLIDYWCRKNVRGLIQMPFSRHWIMHTEACLRIKNRIKP